MFHLSLPRVGRVRLVFRAVTVAACLLATGPVLGEETAPIASPRGAPVSLAELLAYADAHAPTLLVAQRRRGYADALRADAEPTLRNNPTASFGIGPRFDGASQSDFDFVAALEQPVEIGGERGLRMDVAARTGDRLGAEAVRARWELRRELTLAFRAAVVAHERVLLGDRLVQFAEEMLSIAQRRLVAGDSTAIDVRLAETELAQAAQTRLLAKQELQTLRLRLAEQSGWSIEDPPQVRAGLTPPGPVPSLDVVFRLARDAHPELAARSAAVNEAGAHMALSDREAWPTPVFGVQVAREGSAGSPANYIVLGTVGVALPFWQSNQGERARHRVDQEVARAEESAGVTAVQARVARSHAELAVATERLALFTTGVAQVFDESLTLLQRGFEAGEIPLLTLAITRERFLAVQRDSLAAYGEYYRALTELEFAAGTEIPGSTTTGGAL